MKNKKLGMLTIAVFICAGCSERVSPGYVGMVMTTSGLSGELLQPGNHSCWGRDRLILVETVEPTVTESLNVLCSDDLNFRFDLKVRSRLRKTDSKAMIMILEKQGARVKWDGSVGILQHSVLYQNYVQPAARSIARSVVSKYSTTQIRENREAIQKVIQTDLVASMNDTPMEVVMVATSNFDYPEVITQAVEKKRKKEIEIDEEKAKQAMELLKAENRLKIALKMKIVRATEAQADAAYMKILGKALTDKYLRLRWIETTAELYNKASPGDKVIVTPSDNPIMQLVGKK